MKFSLFYIALLSFLMISCSGKKDNSIQDPVNKNRQKIITQKGTDQLENYRDCPMEGNAKPDRVKQLNLLKNRYTAPTDINPKINLAAIERDGNDENRFSVHDGAEITGYVYDVKPGGVETCNCKEKDIAYRDTHIEIIANPMNSPPDRRIIVEITPRWREIMSKKGVDWSTRAIRDKFLGRWVKVTGWMLFDIEHGDEAEHTNPGRPRNWRETAWEIHPVTDIQVINRPAKPAL